MKYAYPAVFFEEDGKISAVFPDLGNLAASGDNIEDAICEAQDVCGGYLFKILCDGGSFPDSSMLSEVDITSVLRKIKKETAVDSAFINIVLVDMTEYTRLYSGRAVKKSISIPMWLNTLCEKEGINFSKVLQEALLTKIQSLKKQ